MQRKLSLAWPGPVMNERVAIHTRPPQTNYYFSYNTSADKGISVLSLLVVVVQEPGAPEHNSFSDGQKSSYTVVIQGGP